MITTRPIDEKSERGSVAPGLARLLGEVGDRLEPGVGEHRERQREEEVVPALPGREVEAVRRARPGENTHASPSTTTSSCTAMSSSGEDERGRVDAACGGRAARRRSRTIAATAIMTSHGLSVSDGAESDAAR